MSDSRWSRDLKINTGDEPQRSRGRCETKTTVSVSSRVGGVGKSSQRRPSETGSTKCTVVRTGLRVKSWVLEQSTDYSRKLCHHKKRKRKLLGLLLKTLVSKRWRGPFMSLRGRRGYSDAEEPPIFSPYPQWKVKRHGHVIHLSFTNTSLTWLPCNQLGVSSSLTVF